jgi:hypothetical protein
MDIKIDDLEIGYQNSIFSKIEVSKLPLSL